ncbi:MAG: hypothetical protein OEO20_08880 [Gemmatimonadota bacterium]|nr:hypothetical protein [Gemmatimonadota bacterium]MDH3367241.1 hypothetical protein [Gemmatimonadota bacterium]MDH3478403.1 hypothetical protein [Gemmatimonadota bacterium]MDH3570466.1 hypothetical protein [Gemmatimonadota bacterium]MDH5548951.1 hypothetical protein [Gemmatimonadota bacterium]
MNRLDAFTHAFGLLSADRFPEIHSDAKAEVRDTTDRSQFVALRSVQHLLGEVEHPALIERDPEAAAEYLNALFVTYRFWDVGSHVIQIARDALSAVLSSPPSDMPEVPHGACYLLFPERWFWARIGPDEPHEPLDGIFMATGDNGREISVLAVLGLRADRPGFSQVTISVSTEEFVTVHPEVNTSPFAPTLDGGEAAGLKSVSTMGELLYLTRLALATC